MPDDAPGGPGFLTDLGRTLLAPIGALGEWAFQYGDEVLDAQDRYEAETGDEVSGARS